MERGKLVDALQAEMLSDLTKINQQLENLKTDMPGFLAGVKVDCETAASTMKKAFDDFQSSAMALAEFVKRRQQETLGEIGKVHDANMTLTEKRLEGFTKYFWLVTGIGGVSVIINLLTLVFVLKR